jgi:hypothetical protein
MMVTTKAGDKQTRNIGEEILGGLREIKRGTIGRVAIYPSGAGNCDPVDPKQAKPSAIGVRS